MAPRGSPLFLERGSYRQRRVMDAARLVVFLGVGLWMIPLLWPTAGAAEEAVPMSRALLYVFGVWALLIVASVYLAYRMRWLPKTPEDAEAP
ncbi:hypothetical protein [uncultured Roseobacter sp.]|uniref:hypothetical protein n=1 Tax=uncultured Roseobacter sp. TaxID=114847 RepID=UPI002606769C|nr:hypothetical protein [uncultured Roseobacter sp.]